MTSKTSGLTKLIIIAIEVPKFYSWETNQIVNVVLAKRYLIWDPARQKTSR